MKRVHASDELHYFVGGKTALGIQPCSEECASQFKQGAAGLHHLCFRAKSRQDIDDFHKFLKSVNAVVVREPQEGPWAHGYYHLIFEDPNGVRLEINYVPESRAISARKYVQSVK